MTSGICKTKFLAMPRLFFAVAFALTVQGCSSAGVHPADNLIRRLEDRGPVALSSDNPYLAANLLLAREMDASPELKGFIEHRGAPAALEIVGGLFDPLMLQLYYPEKREQYNLESSAGLWIIRGPEMIEREKMKEVGAITHDPRYDARMGSDSAQILTSKRPVFAPGGSPLGATGAAISAAPQAADPFLAKLEAAGERGDRKIALDQNTRPFSSPQFPAPAPIAPIFQPADRPASAAEDSQLVGDIISHFGPHPAETSPKGDVVHYVTYPGETLTLLARWYTFDRLNANKIARINSVRNANVLSIGDQIVIPAYLAKNKNRLTEEGLKALLAKK